MKQFNAAYAKVWVAPAGGNLKDVRGVSVFPSDSAGGEEAMWGLLCAAVVRSHGVCKEWAPCQTFCPPQIVL